ncbi:hypothetical protein KZ773_02170 [Escherichia coli]|nr:hypothetical protein [Escherichia coli]
MKIPFHTDFYKKAAKSQAESAPVHGETVCAGIYQRKFGGRQNTKGDSVPVLDQYDINMGSYEAKLLVI